jgi:hypothetical protein
MIDTREFGLKTCRPVYADTAQLPMIIIHDNATTRMLNRVRV